MNLRPQYRKTVSLLLILSNFGWLAAPARAAQLDVAQQPMFLTGSVDPNIMLMIDSSGSMKNIVPDAPYDPAITYLAKCTGNVLVEEGKTVSLVVSSGQPKIRIDGTNYNWGTKNGQKCFASNADYDASLITDASGSLPAQYKGNYLNWYFNTSTDPVGCANSWAGGQKPCARSRIEIAKTASRSLIDNLGADNRVGLSKYNGSNGGTLLEVVDGLTTAKRTAIKADIDAISASGYTPLAETLADIGYYFSRGATNLTLHPDTSPVTQTRADVFSAGYTRSSTWNSGGNPVQYFCQKSFAVMLTDGRPTEDRSISKYLCDYDGDTPDADGSSCPNYDKKAGQDYESMNSSDFLDDVAMALYEIDLRPDLSDPDGKMDDKNNVTTFMIGFADDQVINDPLMIDTATNGGGLFLQAANAQDLVKAFDKIADTIKQDKPSAAALAANSTSVEMDAVVFQAVFDSTDWSGDLVAFPVGKDGVVAVASPYWKAATKLTDPAARKIYTFEPGTSQGVDFSWSALHPQQQDKLDVNPDTKLDDNKGSDRLAWIRGVHDKEVRKAGGEFRSRYIPSKNQEWILGDIVNSDPVFMHANDFGYETLQASEADSYADYKKAKTAGKPVVFIGGNDGMLHAFRADVGDPKSGEELFAYVPNGVYENLSKLTSVDYSHTYFVDGSPTVGDAYFDGAWHTMLIGSLGAGGKSVFALDVTEFATKAPELAVPTASKIVKWEISDANDIGLTYSKPQIARLNNGEWAAIFGNGYNSKNEQAFLYVVNIKTGSVIKKLAAGAAGSNGLSTPALYDQDGDRIIDYVYAGDLQGNLWKFDLSSKTDASEWGVAYAGSPVFKAVNKDGQSQPITAQPVLGTPPAISPTPADLGVMVYFGTGQYLEAGDIASDYPVQSFYGIWDNGSAITDDRDEVLQQQSIISTTTAFDATLRRTTDEDVEWDTQRGWYMDFDVSGVAGERVITQALLRYDRVIFLTMIPSTAVCQPGGTSWLMELDALTGARTKESSFDFNDDGNFDSDDFVEGTSVSGYKSTVGITKPPAWFTGKDGKDFKVMTGTTGGIESVGNKGGTPPPPPPPGSMFRRTYWMQIQ